jgi:hypothetical protein
MQGGKKTEGLPATPAKAFIKEYLSVSLLYGNLYMLRLLKWIKTEHTGNAGQKVIANGPVLSRKNGRF